MTILKNILLLLCITIPLSAMAEEFVISPAYLPEGKILNLKYNPPLDPYFCDKNYELCKKLNQNDIPIFDLEPGTTGEQWFLFWTFQILDIYSTSKALKYDCIKEVNPLFTESPNTSRIIFTKSFLLIPGLVYDDYWKAVTPNELDDTNMFYAAVVGNNFRLLHKAKQNCNKIR